MKTLIAAALILIAVPSFGAENRMQPALATSSPAPVSPFQRPLALQSDKLASTSTSTEPWSGTYRYDANSRVRGIGDNVYSYDGAGRLTQATAITAAQNETRTYAYDAFGNLLTQTTSSGVDAAGVNWQTNRIEQPAACPAGSNCIVATYDAGGNQLSGGGATYAFDAVNMMTELQASGRHDIYVYDADDQRIATASYVDGQNQAWHYAVRDLQQKVVREVDDVVAGGQHSYAWRKDYVYRDNALLAAASSAGGSDARVHFHLDHLGSPRLITDALGVKLSMHAYWPFGREAAGSDNDAEAMKYTGHERDFAGPGNINDLDYMHARYYTPVAARFLSVDIVPGKARKPQSWNRYVYADNDPMALIDPTGEAVTITITRDTYTNTAVTGTISVTSDRRGVTSFSGFTLETTGGGPRHTTPPIPAGSYAASVRADHDPHRVELNDVPDRSNIQIHVGNTATDVEGCFAVGTERGTDRVDNSRTAMDQINNIIHDDGSNQITVQVAGSPTAPPPPPPPPQQQQQQNNDPMDELDPTREVE